MLPNGAVRHAMRRHIGISAISTHEAGSLRSAPTVFKGSAASGRRETKEGNSICARDLDLSVLNARGQYRENVISVAATDAVRLVLLLLFSCVSPVVDNATVHQSQPGKFR